MKNDPVAAALHLLQAHPPARHRRRPALPHRRRLARAHRAAGHHARAMSPASTRSAPPGPAASSRTTTRATSATSRAARSSAPSCSASSASRPTASASTSSATSPSRASSRTSTAHSSTPCGWDDAERDRVIDEVLLAYRFNTELFIDLAERRPSARARPPRPSSPSHHGRRPLGRGAQIGAARGNAAVSRFIVVGPLKRACQYARRSTLPDH